MRLMKFLRHLTRARPGRRGRPECGHCDGKSARYKKKKRIRIKTTLHTLKRRAFFPYLPLSGELVAKTGHDWWRTVTLADVTEPSLKKGSNPLSSQQDRRTPLVFTDMFIAAGASSVSVSTLRREDVLKSFNIEPNRGGGQTYTHTTQQMFGHRPRCWYSLSMSVLMADWNKCCKTMGLMNSQDKGPYTRRPLLCTQTTERGCGCLCSGCDRE